MATQPPSPENSVVNSASDRLDSWKEIASYLKREIRTVQRWEALEGLPVHRHLHRKQGSVYAYKTELDVWWHNHTTTVAPEDESDDASRISVTLPESEQSESGSGSPVGSFPAVQVDQAYIDKAQPPEDNPVKSPWIFRHRLVISVCAVFLLASIGAFLIEGRRALVLRLSQIDSLYLSGNRLVAVTSNGSAVWDYTYPLAPTKMLSSQIIPKGFCTNEGNDALVLLSWEKPSPLDKGPNLNDEIDCFSKTGKLVWQFLPDDSFVFGAETFSPPWRGSSFQVLQAGKDKWLAVVFHHAIWWPAEVIILNIEGKALHRFVNAGWISGTKLVETTRGPLILVGGMNNAQNGAMLAVLDAPKMDGASPEVQGSAYECKNCPNGSPLRYFVFPRTEINVASGAMIDFANLDEGGNQILARTRETYGSENFGSAEVIYTFSYDLDLAYAKFADRYWDIHRELQLTGMIDHDKDHCLDRKGPRLVRMWDPKTGWTDLHPN